MPLEIVHNQARRACTHLLILNLPFWNVSLAGWSGFRGNSDQICSIKVPQLVRSA